MCVRAPSAAAPTSLAVVSATCKQVFYGAFPVTVHHMAMFGYLLLFVSQRSLAKVAF